MAALALGLTLFASAAAAAPDPNPTWNVDARILLRARAEPFDHYAVKDPTIVFSGTATVSWSGALSSANLYVETTSGTGSFYIDDASFR